MAGYNISPAATTAANAAMQPHRPPDRRGALLLTKACEQVSSEFAGCVMLSFSHVGRLVECQTTRHADQRAAVSYSFFRSDTLYTMVDFLLIEISSPPCSRL